MNIEMDDETITTSLDFLNDMVSLTITFMVFSTLRIPLLYMSRVILHKILPEKVDRKIVFDQKSIMLDFSRPIVLCLSLSMITPGFVIGITIFGAAYYLMLKVMLFRTDAFRNSQETCKHFLPSFFPWILNKGIYICFVRYLASNKSSWSLSTGTTYSL